MGWDGMCVRCLTAWVADGKGKTSRLHQDSLGDCDAARGRSGSTRTPRQPAPRALSSAARPGERRAGLAQLVETCGETVDGSS